jgi:CDP-2,3-bis-(O-geranylgeranyl)-sn-glycerol synthase
MTAEWNAVALAAFLIAAFSVAGACQALWLSAAVSRRFDRPLDGGRRWRGRRFLGDNKTLRGFVVMVPATAAGFALVAAALPVGAAKELWPLSISAYALLGGWAGLGFMAGELPNSFVKRQLDVAPGAAATGRVLGPLFAIADRCDSVLGAMVALALVVPVPVVTWLLVSVAGPAIHGLFSAAIFYLGGKARLA